MVKSEVTIDGCKIPILVNQAGIGSQEKLLVESAKVLRSRRRARMWRRQDRSLVGKGMGCRERTEGVPLNCT